MCELVYICFYIVHTDKLLHFQNGVIDNVYSNFSVIRISLHIASTETEINQRKQYKNINHEHVIYWHLTVDPGSNTLKEFHFQKIHNSRICFLFWNWIELIEHFFITELSHSSSLYATDRWNTYCAAIFCKCFKIDRSNFLASVRQLHI